MRWAFIDIKLKQVTETSIKSLSFTRLDWSLDYSIVTEGSKGSNRNNLLCSVPESHWHLEKEWVRHCFLRANTQLRLELQHFSQ
jgi:hypothetical protein